MNRILFDSPEIRINSNSETITIFLKTRKELIIAKNQYIIRGIENIEEVIKEGD